MIINLKNVITLKGKILFFLIIIACNQNANKHNSQSNQKVYNEIARANWFLGEWRNVSENNVFVEIWNKLNDSTMFGKSFFIVGKDTLGSESITLMQTNNELLYIPKVKDHNKNKEVIFKLTKSSANVLIFENPKHDFPTKISYHLITNDSLIAEISGMQNGKLNVQKFPFAKRK